MRATVAWLRLHLNDVRDGAAVVVVTAVLVAVLFHPWPGRLRVPMSYKGDALQAAQIVDTTIHRGWYQSDPRLGAPHGLRYYDFPLEADNANLLMIRLLGFGSHDWALVLNAFYLAGFFLAALTAFFVLRALAVSRSMALVGAELFAFLPYHFIRGESHFLLSSYFMVPVGVLVALWLMSETPPFCRVVSGRLAWDWRSRRGWLSVAACVLLASTGLYYAVFAAMLMAVGAVFVSLRRFELMRGVAALALVGVVGGMLALNYAPSILYVMQHGSNPAIAHRYPFETDAFGLRIGQLVTPVLGHRIHAFADFNARAVDPLDFGLGEYLGFVGSVGLVVVVLSALAVAARRRAQHDERGRGVLTQLGALCIAMMLIGSTGGVARVTAVIVGAEIRAWYRICVVIGFCALAGVAVWVDRLARRAVRTRRFRVLGRRGVPQLLAVTLLVIGILDQTNPTIVPSLTAGRPQFAVDAAFVTEIERTLGPGRSVFQLPYVAFPESPPVGRVAGYDQFIGFLHSQTLRWSFGAVDGRDDWQAAVGRLPARPMLDAIVTAGFDGLWIDRFGYPASARALERTVGDLVGAAPLVSADGRRSFFDLRAYRRALADRVGASALARSRRSILNPVVLTWAQGFYLAESSSLGIGHWAQLRARLVIRNPGAARRAVLSFDVLTAASAPATVTILGPHVRRVVDASGSVQHVEVALDLRHGDTTLELSDNGLAVPEATPTRDPRVGIWNARLSGIEIVVGDGSREAFPTAPSQPTG